MKLENILLGMLYAVFMFNVTLTIVTICAIINVYNCIRYRSLEVMWDGIKDDMNIVWHIVRMVEHVFKTGDIKEAEMRFYEETGIV